MVGGVRGRWWVLFVVVGDGDCFVVVGDGGCFVRLGVRFVRLAHHRPRVKTPPIWLKPRGAGPFVV